MRKTKLWKMMVLGVLTGSILMAGGCGAKTEKETAATETASEGSADTVSAKAEGMTIETEEALPDSADADSQVLEDTPDSDIFEKMDTEDLDGNKVDSSLFAENKLTLVNVWNVGCTPCVQEIPILDQLNKEYEGKGVAIKGLYYELAAGLAEESRSDVESVLKDAGASYQQLLVSEDMFADDMMQNLMTFPTTYFVDSNGKIVKAVMGSNDYDTWKKLIEDTLAEMQ